MDKKPGKYKTFLTEPWQIEAWRHLTKAIEYMYNSRRGQLDSVTRVHYLAAMDILQDALHNVTINERSLDQIIHLIQAWPSRVWRR
jgi:hypothetical protein